MSGTVFFKNIIFDFGGVICNIDPDRTVQAFKELGFDSAMQAAALMNPRGLFYQLETGQLSPGDFRNAIRQLAGLNIPDQKIDEAWNALLLDIPLHRIVCIEKLRSAHKVFLLSNTNLIHYQCFLKDFQNKFGYRDFNDLFHRVWLSFRLKLHKPDPAIFQFVLADAGILPNETIFIDDSEENVRAAELTGIKGLQIGRNTEFSEVLEICDKKNLT